MDLSNLIYCSLFSILLCWNFKQAQAYTPTTTPATAYALGLGLGIGLPFICNNYYNAKAIQKLLKVKFRALTKVSELKKIENKKAVKCPEDLEWGNDPKDAPCKASFYELTGLPQDKGKDNWNKIMGNKYLPGKKYMVAAVKKSRFSVNLISSALEKQLGDAVLKFNYWLTPEVSLNVCLLHEDADFEDPQNCTKPIQGGKNHEARFVIPGPISHPFKLSIQTFNFGHNKASIMVLDDIQYRFKSTRCK